MNMEKWIIGLLLVIPLQIVSGQDKNTGVQKTPDPTHRWMVGVQLGGSSLLASSLNDEHGIHNLFIDALKWTVPKHAIKFNKQLKQGWNINSDIHFMRSENFGLGVKYSFFTLSSQNVFFPNYFSYSEYQCAEMKQKLYVNYAGPSVIFRQWLHESQKLQLTETISAGYVHYRDEIREYANYPTSYNVLLKSNTLATNVSLFLGYCPVPRLSIGANFGLFYAYLTKVNIGTSDYYSKLVTQKAGLDKGYRSLIRFDYSIDIRLIFN